jgi:hypothetical protein
MYCLLCEIERKVDANNVENNNDKALPWNRYTISICELVYNNNDDVGKNDLK